MHTETGKCVSLKGASFILKRCKKQVIELKKTGISFKTSLHPEDVLVVVFEGIPHTLVAHPP